jgi:mRNA interferase RelE/StbE
MEYRIEYLAEAIRDLDKLDPQLARRLIRKIDAMRVDLAGDVKRLTDYEPRYRLRVGDWRVLFDLSSDAIVVHRVLHRGKAYD